MKKILFASYSLDLGGIETALITLLKHLAPKYDITLVLERKQGIFLDQIPNNVNIVTYTASECKIKILRKFINLLKQVKFKIKYKNKFDFSASFATYSFPCSFIARNASKNSALWVHNNYMNFYGEDIIQYRLFFNRLKAEKFNRIVFVSDYDRKTFIGQFPECAKKAIECNNLIDYKSIIDKSKETVEDFSKTSGTTFINIGRHDEKQKRLSRIIQATEKLNKEGYKFRVVFVGKGSDTNIYKKESKKIKNIVFLGAKKNPYPYLKMSDCFLLSSQFEGYPVVFVESQILGKPIVTTEVSDSKKDIEGKYGIVVENSEEGVYKGMKDFLDKGFTPIEFSPEDFNNKILEKLDMIIQNK